MDEDEGAQEKSNMASTSTTNGPQSIEISQLPLPQLDNLKAQLDEVLKSTLSIFIFSAVVKY